MNSTRAPATCSGLIWASLLVCVEKIWTLRGHPARPRHLKPFLSTYRAWPKKKGGKWCRSLSYSSLWFSEMEIFIIPEKTHKHIMLSESEHNLQLGGWRTARVTCLCCGISHWAQHLSFSMGAFGIDSGVWGVTMPLRWRNETCYSETGP